jgi:hypothetical protein
MNLRLVLEFGPGLWNIARRMTASKKKVPDHSLILTTGAGVTITIE